MSTFTDSMDSVNYLGTDENSLETSRPMPSDSATAELASPKNSGNVSRGKKMPQMNDSTGHSTSLSQMLQKRRSSSRSIKRKKFDDELVESSLIKTNRGSRQQPNPSPSISLGTLQTITQPSGFAEPVSTEVSVPPLVERKKSSKPSSKRAKKSKVTNFQAIVARDLGRWKPTDDLTLIIAVQQTNDLAVVHRGIKFSCKFTLKEIQERWYALLYDSVISKMAVSAMKQIHPESIAAVQSKALFSQAEEALLATVPSTSQPSLESFQDLLSKNHEVFYLTRTTKSLYNYWLLMKQYHLLPDQTVQKMPKGQHVLNFSDAEDLVNDSDFLLDPNDEVLEHELSLADRRVKREIRNLENELPKWQVLVDSVTGITPADFDPQTLAVLRGRLVRYLMRSKEISFGRATKDNSVDVDLSLEGPAWKISRRQGMIKLNTSGEFYAINEGKRSLYVDGKPILGGSKCKLNNNSIVEISGLRFIFFINQELINAVRSEASKMAS
uniref:Microspherule protein 1 n=1 Tax=Strigamia maritima TaxID=126957 RepID=T1IRH1_STRMM